jgi:hypothetical protein
MGLLNFIWVFIKWSIFWLVVTTMHPGLALLLLMFMMVGWLDGEE